MVGSKCYNGMREMEMGRWEEKAGVTKDRGGEMQTEMVGPLNV